MCEPQKSRVAPVGLVVAGVVGAGTAVAAIHREATHTATPTPARSAVSGDSGGFPLVLTGLVAAAVFVVVAVLVARWLYVRRRYVVPAVDRAPIRAEVIQPRQRELTAGRPVPGAATQGPPVRIRVNARMTK